MYGNTLFPYKRGFFFFFRTYQRFLLFFYEQISYRYNARMNTVTLYTPQSFTRHTCIVFAKIHIVRNIRVVLLIIAFSRARTVCVLKTRGCINPRRPARTEKNKNVNTRRLYRYVQWKSRIFWANVSLRQWTAGVSSAWIEKVFRFNSSIR